MNKPVLLDRSYDLILSMTWMPDHPHGISGHVYEIIDYYLLLRNHFKVGILFGDTFTTWCEFEKVIADKYDVPDDILDEMEHNTMFYNVPKIIRGKNILFVDGGFKRLQSFGAILAFKTILSFKCSRFDTIHDVHYKDIILLQDERVYNDIAPEDIPIGMHYRKKLNFKYLKTVNHIPGNTALIYATGNCKFVQPGILADIVRSYDFDTYMVITTVPSAYKDMDRVLVREPVVDNLFEKFDTYIYTPIEQVWDGSPRLPAECRHYGKDVLYYGIDDEYLANDTGLKYRKHDIENDFDSLHLNDDDEIIDIIKQSI